MIAVGNSEEMASVAAVTDDWIVDLVYSQKVGLSYFSLTYCSKILMAFLKLSFTVLESLELNSVKEDLTVW